MAYLAWHVGLKLCLNLRLTSIPYGANLHLACIRGKAYTCGRHRSMHVYQALSRSVKQKLTVPTCCNHSPLCCTLCHAYIHLSSQSSSSLSAAITILTQPVCASGTGLDFSAASAVVFVELPQEVALVRQAEDRAHRHGQKLSVNVYFLVAKGTSDERRCVATPNGCLYSRARAREARSMLHLQLTCLHI